MWEILCRTGHVCYITICTLFYWFHFATIQNIISILKWSLNLVKVSGFALSKWNNHGPKSCRLEMISTLEFINCEETIHFTEPKYFWEKLRFTVESWLNRLSVFFEKNINNNLKFDKLRKISGIRPRQTKRPMTHRNWNNTYFDWFKRVVLLNIFFVIVFNTFCKNTNYYK